MTSKQSPPPRIIGVAAPTATTSLASLTNLGPKSAAFLAAAGIKTLDQLAALGAVAAYAKVKMIQPKTSLNLLWALEGAL
ncbi:MAG: hypothetical protein HC782_03595, partial [Gammaproteobacteria bacterium]|nr:hypothetical protein [Gammaproteobacteria bacterium]